MEVNLREILPNCNFTHLVFSTDSQFLIVKTSLIVCDFVLISSAYLVQCLACGEWSVEIFVECIHDQYQRSPCWPQVDSDPKHSNLSVSANVRAGMDIACSLFFHCFSFLISSPQSLNLSLLCANFLQFVVYRKSPVFIVIPVSWQRCKTE